MQRKVRVGVIGCGMVFAADHLLRSCSSMTFSWCLFMILSQSGLSL